MVRKGRSERGEALLESVLSILVLSIVAVAIYGGLSTTTLETVQRRTRTADLAALQSVAEHLQSPDVAYIARAGCATGAAYDIPARLLTDGHAVTITSVAFWTGASATPATSVSASFTDACPVATAADHGLQQITLTARDGDRTRTLVVLKRRP